jgi:hypothetical protein
MEGEGGRRGGEEAAEVGGVREVRLLGTHLPRKCCHPSTLAVGVTSLCTQQVL